MWYDTDNGIEHLEVVCYGFDPIKDIRFGISLQRSY